MMNKKNVQILIVTFLMSGLVWWLSIYNGWLQELILFEKGSIMSMFTNNYAEISNDENVTVVNYGQFAYRHLKSIVIPDNIKTIENKAFHGNRLISITIGKDVSLGENSFGSQFESVYNNYKREASTYTRSSHKSTEWIIWHDNFGFTNNDNITITDFKGSGTAIIPDIINDIQVVRIGEEAFRYKNLTSITIPNGITQIDRRAFGNNSLTSVSIPDTVVSIDGGAFGDNQIKNVTIGSSVLTIGNNAFGNNQLTSVKIPNSVTNIDDFAFQKNQLTNIFIPNSVKNIGINAFAENKITRVSIGANVTLGDGDNNQGVLGRNTGFNSAYQNNGKKAGVYTRPNVNTTNWSRSVR